MSDCHLLTLRTSQCLHILHLVGPGHSCTASQKHIAMPPPLSLCITPVTCIDASLYINVLFGVVSQPLSSVLFTSRNTRSAASQCPICGFKSRHHHRQVRPSAHCKIFKAIYQAPVGHQPSLDPSPAPPSSQKCSSVRMEWRPLWPQPSQIGDHL